MGDNYVNSKIKPLFEDKNSSYVLYDSIYEYACWADDIRNSATSPWHFYDIPFFDGYTTNVTLPEKNVAWLINTAKDVLSGKSKAYTKAAMIRYLIHMMGDAH